MTQDDIIRMAREAGVTDPTLGECVTDYGDATEDLERFAALVAAAEREACAKVCEEYDDDLGTGETWGPRFAAMIRARGATHD